MGGMLAILILQDHFQYAYTYIGAGVMPSHVHHDHIVCSLVVRTWELWTLVGESERKQSPYYSATPTWQDYSDLSRLFVRMQTCGAYLCTGLNAGQRTLVLTSAPFCSFFFRKKKKKFGCMMYDWTPSLFSCACHALIICISLQVCKEFVPSYADHGHGLFIRSCSTMVL